MNEQAARDLRRLGVFSLGFLWQPTLRRALADAGWQVTPGVGPHDAVGVWGRRGVARRGLGAAQISGKPVVTIEDGFLRSVRPGETRPVISLILDDVGVYYDSAAPSRLEQLIANGGGDLKRAESGIARLRAARLSKYNHAPALLDPPSGHILVVDQTRGDASITFGGATADSFDRMLAAARADHPGREIIVKSHPDVAMGRKAGHLTPDRVQGARLIADDANPWDLIEGAAAVYTVSSQLGFEALIAGKPVRCFGAPFYAGWGATEDEAPIIRRTARRTAAEIFAAAYLDYPLYFDPWRGGVTGFEAACDALEVLRAAHERNRQPAICSGVRLWKRRYVADFLKGASNPPRFQDNAVKAASEAQRTGARHVVWGQPANSESATRVEDGFLRSVGLGAALTPPLSLSFDDLGIYYDPSRPSRLEALIEAAPETAATRARARHLIDLIVENGVTKYNTGQAAPARPDHPRVILAPGQVEDDASITLGAGKVRTNLALLQSIRRDAPDAWVIYKPHPDVEAGLRPGAISPEDLAGLVDDVAGDADAHDCLEIADEVWTMTSLMGFEGLIRGKPVTCYGAPFYAGWGLTRDRSAPPDRRRARPSLEALVHAVLIDYPAYRDPVSGLACTPELIVERLSHGVGRAGVAGRALSKAQGLMASYAWIWR